MVSVYGFVGEGLSDGNMRFLGQVGEHVAEQGGQWVIAGDFNLAPEEVTSTGWLARVRGAIIGRTTCGQRVEGREIDYCVIPGGACARYRAVKKLHTGIPTYDALEIGIRQRGPGHGQRARHPKAISGGSGGRRMAEGGRRRYGHCQMDELVWQGGTVAAEGHGDRA